jgi:hypothetical protein
MRSSYSYNWSFIFSYPYTLLTSESKKKKNDSSVDTAVNSSFFRLSSISLALF